MEHKLKIFTATFDPSVGEYLEKEVEKWRTENTKLIRNILGQQIAIHNLNVILMVNYTEEHKSKRL